MRIFLSLILPGCCRHTDVYNNGLFIQYTDKSAHAVQRDIRQVERHGIALQVDGIFTHPAGNRFAGIAHLAGNRKSIRKPIIDWYTVDVCFLVRASGGLR